MLDGFVYVQGQRIVSVSTESRPCETLYDFTGKIVAPGFVDLHTHGAGGHSFSGSSPEAVLAACNAI